MFTGIVEETGKVTSAAGEKLTVAARATLDGLKPGDSISVNGVCLTVTALSAGIFSADVMPETLRRTNLGRLQPGDAVNLERPVTLGGRLGGHLVQGHVDGTGRVTSLAPEGDAVLATIEAPPEIMRYAVPKGFIAADGVSLTITERDSRSFRVSLVGYTRAGTILGSWKTGHPVNLEADIIAKYVAQVLQPPQAGLTAGFLAEHGFEIR